MSVQTGGYLDRPQDDNTHKAHPAFNRGKIKGILFLFIMISLFVAIFNLLPIPLLDGGHIIYFALRSIFSDTLPHIVTRIYLLIGITIISFLFIVVTFNDIFYK